MPDICILTLTRPSHRYVASRIVEAFGSERCGVIWQRSAATRTPDEHAAWMRKRLGDAAYESYRSRQREFAFLEDASRAAATSRERALFGDDHDLRGMVQTTVDNINDDPETIASMSPHALLMFGGPILTPPIISLPIPIKLNQHTGRLPDYRGSWSLEHAILDRRWDAIEVTVHELTARLDHGRICARATTALRSGDTVADLFFRLTVLGTEAMIDATRRLLDGGPIDAIDPPDGRPARRTYDFTPDDRIALRAMLGGSQLPDPTARLRPDAITAFEEQTVRIVHPAKRRALPACDAFRRDGRPCLINLYYHGVAPDEGPGDNEPIHTVPERRFIAQLEYLRSHLEPIGMAEGVRRLRAGELRETRFTISFDDGLATVHDVAYPVLRRLSVPFTVFINTAFLDNADRSWELKLAALHRRGIIDVPGLNAAALIARHRDDFVPAEIATIERLHTEHIAAPASKPYLTRAQLSAMADFAEVANHTHRHHRLARLSPERQREEITRAAAELKQHPNAVSLLAAPYGRAIDIDQHSVAICRELGLELVMVEPAVMCDPADPFVRRVCLRSDDWATELLDMIAGRDETPTMTPTHHAPRPVASSAPCGLRPNRSDVVAQLIRAKFDDLSQRGDHIILIGAGQFTAWVLEVLSPDQRMRIAFIHDDAPSIDGLQDVPVHNTVERSLPGGVAIVSTDTHFRALAARSRAIYPQCEVHSFFEDLTPQADPRHLL
jgi:peptidoglycan/xylan/chitin deacetylase (PgdA/CDA1 family)